MSALPALRTARRAVSVTPQLDASEFGWLTYRLPDDTDKLPTVEQERTFLAELEAANEPVALDDLQNAIGRMVEAYPQAAKQDRRGYALALFEQLGEYPRDVVAGACREMVRTCKFLPSVAELVEACDRLSEKRRTALAALAYVSTERERRRVRTEKTKLLGAISAADRVLHRMAQERIREALTEAVRGFVPLDIWHMGLPTGWYKRLREAAMYDIVAEWESWPGEPKLPDVVASYAEWSRGPVVLGDDWPPAAPDFPTDGGDE